MAEISDEAVKLDQHARPFRDRMDAGAQLAQRLLHHAGRADVTVVALPRGGVPVAAVVAARLEAPLDVLIVRKVGVPGHRELAAGAVGPGGVTQLDHDLMGSLGLTEADLRAVIDEERAERDRRERAYRQGRAALDLAVRTVLIVDDGLATGSTMLAAVSAARALAPAAVVVAVPVASPSGFLRLSAVADEVVAVTTPPRFIAVGQWFDDFEAVTDRDVRRWLRPPPAGLEPV